MRLAKVLGYQFAQADLDDLVLHCAQLSSKRIANLVEIDPRGTNETKDKLYVRGV